MISTFAISGLLGLGILSIFSGGKDGKNTPDRWPPFQFEARQGEQEAVVFMSMGFTGGMGEAALDADRQMLRVEDRPVYWSGAAERRVMEEVKVPASWSGMPMIQVKARISVDQATARNFSIPGAPERTYMSISILSLEEVRYFFPEGNGEEE